MVCDLVAATRALTLSISAGPAAWRYSLLSVVLIVAEQLAGGSSANFVLGRIWPVELFKEQLIYEQSAARTVREQQEKRPASVAPTTEN